MRKCRTCGCPLWLAWLIVCWPFQERVKAFKDAEDCIDLLPKKLCDALMVECRAEVERMDERAKRWKEEARTGQMGQSPIQTS